MAPHNPNPKPPDKQNLPKYRKWISEQRCIVCGAWPPSDPMHQRVLNGAGMSQKPCDTEILPGCRTCHDYEDKNGYLALWNDRGRLVRKFVDKNELRDFIRWLCNDYYERYILEGV